MGSIASDNPIPNTLWRLWENHGKTNHGKTMGKPWENGDSYVKSPF